MFLTCVHLTIVKSRSWLLKRDAASTGVDWAEHLEARIVGLSDGTNKKPSAGVPESAELTRLVSDVLAIGNIYQIDFINADCLCELSFSSLHLPVDGLRNGFSEPEISNKSILDFSKHKHKHKPVVTTGEPPQSAVKHVFRDLKATSPRIQNTNGTHRLPVDRPFVRSVIDAKSHTIRIRNDIATNQPTTFAEVYHPIVSGGKTVYLVRALVNLAERSQRYTRLLYTGAALVIFLLMLAFGYPARLLLQTSKRQRASDERARYLANHDGLTGISNRNAFQERILKCMADCTAKGEATLLFLIDVDDFKDINDYHGHHAGDMVLIDLAEKLSQLAPAGSLIARLGGDEFAIAMCGRHHIDIPANQILNIPEKFNVQIGEDGSCISVALCAGLARFPRDGADLKELMQHADLALYQAKEARDEQIVEFDSQMGSAFKQRMSLFGEFRLALENSDIVPFYQPLVNLQTGQVEGFEALARWRHRERGIVGPAEFFEVFDDLQLSSGLGSLMLSKVLRDAGNWKASGIDFKCVGINVGEGDLMRPDLVSDVETGLATNGLVATDLAIEVTENTICGKYKETGLGKLNQLRNLGCSIALDDFGTGYSSITHIKELPCTTVKVDKSFVDKVVDNEIDQAIIKALRNLGITAGFNLVIEGVETREQLKLLRSLGCELGQGYYYSPAVPADEVPALIEKINIEFGHSNNSSLYNMSLSA